MNVSSIFNSSLEVGQWLQASNTNFTGSLTLSLLVLLGFLLLIAVFLKMPQLLYIAVLFPLILVVTSIDEFSAIGGSIIGIGILIVALAIMSLFPSK